MRAIKDVDYGKIEVNEYVIHFCRCRSLGAGNSTFCRLESESASRRAGMPVLADHPFRFIHIPKTGGETIEKLISVTKHHFTATDHQFDGQSSPRPFVVTIIRNPYDRVWSWFKFCIHGFKKHHPGPALFCKPALNAFLAASKRLGNSTVGLPNATLVSAWQQTLWQWMQAVDGFMLRPEVRRPRSSYDKNDIARFSMVDYLVHWPADTYAADFVIRFEHYEQDLAALLECLGPPWNKLNASRFHENSSGSDATRAMQPATKEVLGFFAHLSGLTWHQVFTSATREWVCRWFGEDFEYFGYSRGGAGGS